VKHKFSNHPAFKGTFKRKEKFANGTIKKNRDGTAKMETVPRITGTVNPSKY
jgi:hypothetical protein